MSASKPFQSQKIATLDLSPFTMFLNLLLTSAVSANVSTVVTLNDGRQMPSVNLGTCCGSGAFASTPPRARQIEPLSIFSQPISSNAHHAPHAPRPHI
jgi:hypothetical protein